MSFVRMIGKTDLGSESYIEGRSAGSSYITLTGRRGLHRERRDGTGVNVECETERLVHSNPSVTAPSHPDGVNQNLHSTRPDWALHTIDSSRPTLTLAGSSSVGGVQFAASGTGFGSKIGDGET